MSQRLPGVKAVTTEHQNLLNDQIWLALLERLQPLVTRSRYQHCAQPICDCAYVTFLAHHMTQATLSTDGSGAASYLDIEILVHEPLLRTEPAFAIRVRPNRAKKVDAPEVWPVRLAKEQFRMRGLPQ